MRMMRNAQAQQQCKLFIASHFSEGHFIHEILEIMEIPMAAGHHQF